MIHLSSSGFIKRGDSCKKELLLVVGYAESAIYRLIIPFDLIVRVFGAVAGLLRIV